jgi:hypothetical protein
MNTYHATIVVPVEYTIELRASSLEEAEEAAHELEGGDVHGAMVESFGTVKVLEVVEA